MAESEITKTKAQGFGILRALLVVLVCLASVTSANTPDSGTHQDAAAEATQLIEQVDKLNYDGKYLEAVPLAERAVAIREMIFGREHVETAAALDTLCYTYRFAGYYAEAKTAIERALSIRERELGANHLDTARSLNNLGAVYFWLSHFEKAEPLYRRSLEIRRAALGSTHRDTTISMANLGDLYVAQGHGEKGEELLGQALRIRHATTGDSVETADAWSRLGTVLLDRGEIHKAEEAFLKSATIFERTLGSTHPKLASSLLGIGSVAYQLGAYKRAETFLLRGLAIRERSLHQNNLSLAGALNIVGTLYSRVGEYEKAEQYFLRSEATTVRALGPANSQFSSAANNRGELYVLIGKYPEARKVLEHTLKSKEKALGKIHPRYAITLQNLGTVYRLQGEIERAKLAFREALEIQENSLGRFHQHNIQTLISLAALNWQRGDDNLALGYFQRAYEIHSRQSARLLGGGSDSRNQEYLRTLTYDTHRFVSFSIANPSPFGIRVGLDSVLLYKARSADSSLTAIRKRMGAVDTELFNKRAKIAGEISSLAYLPEERLLNRDSYRERLASLGKEQDRIDTELAANNSDYRFQTERIDGSRLRSALPKATALIEWIKYDPFDPAKLGVNGRQIAASSAPRYAAFVVTQNRETAIVDAGDATSINAAVGRFRASISNPKSSDATRRELFDLLLKPIENHLAGIDHLIISPDDALSLVPFAAIANPAGLELNKSFEISYVTSGRDLLKHVPSDTPLTNAVVLANPLFGSIQPLARSALRSTTAERSIDFDRGGFLFRSLDHSEVEAHDLGRLLGPTSTVLTGAKATEAAIKRVHAPSLLHIASHGFFLSDQEFRNDVLKQSGEIADVPTLENPLLRSGLALAGANERKSGDYEDGILTALEVAQLDLNGTELVVLSACDTGLGEVRNGEGVYGLRRALVLAGAQTQVTSLWKVSDEATRILMVSFYKKLLAGEGRSEALRHAQLELMDNPKYSHPYYWASFIPIGDWTPLRSIQQTAKVANTH